MEYGASSSMQTVRPHFPMLSTSVNASGVDINSPPASPREDDGGPAAPPSPPDSPSSDSISSFPSVSSSFFFSSGAASPHTHLDALGVAVNPSHELPHEHEHLSHARAGYPGAGNSVAITGGPGLIIPSLVLPPALRAPTPYGQTLGRLRLLILGRRGTGKTALANFLVSGNPDVVDIDRWIDVADLDPSEDEGDGEDGGDGNRCNSDSDGDGERLLRASSDWTEDRDMHGLEVIEPAKNISILELRGFYPDESPESIVEPILRRIKRTFTSLRDTLQTAPSSNLLRSLVSSPHSPLYTALIYVCTSPPTHQDLSVVSALSPYTPVILLCSPATRHHARQLAQTSSFRPTTAPALLAGLFRNPRTLATLRTEAATAFLRWREVERAVEDIRTEHLRPRVGTRPPQQQHRDAPPGSLNLNLARTRTGTVTRASRPLTTRTRTTTTEVPPRDGDEEEWTKASWEASLSLDLARRLEAKHAALPGSESESDDQSLAMRKRHNKLGALDYSACYAPVLDPLHMRPLVLLSKSLLAPLWNRVLPTRVKHQTLSPSNSQGSSSDGPRWKWGLAALVGMFCAGVGIGLALTA